MRTTAGSKRLLIPVVVAPLLMAAYLSTRPQDLPECPHDWDFSKIRVHDSDGAAGAAANAQRIPASVGSAGYKRMSPSSTTVSD